MTDPLLPQAGRPVSAGRPALDEGTAAPRAQGVGGRAPRERGARAVDSGRAILAGRV